MLNIFLARQPIFRQNREVFGYEILYRTGTTNHFTGTDPDQASSKVIINAFQFIGLNNLTAGKPAFINFSGNLLKQGVATLFPREELVVEIIESVKVDQEIVENCQILKDAGYTMVLDDYLYSEQLKPLLEMVEIVKMDFLALSPEQLKREIATLKKHNVILLAEKIETWEAYCLAQDLGFELFQGYFFSRPEVLSSKSLTPAQTNYLALVEKLSRKKLDFQELTEIISRDLPLTYSLLKLVNSAAFSMRYKIKSVKQALVVLGEEEIRKWITLLTFRQLNSSKVDEVVTNSLVRARFLELLAERTGRGQYKDELYLAGLFSLLDVLLQSPLGEILADLSLESDTYEMLVHGTGKHGELWRFLLAYERGDWNQVQVGALLFNLDVQTIMESYLAAVQWAS